MTEGSEDADRESSTATDAPVGGGVRVEPNAAVVSHDARVPPDPREETPVPFRPVAAARSVGGRLVRRLGRHGDRSRTDGGD